MGEKLGVFLGHPKLQGLPAVMEVPGREGKGPDAEQVQKLRELHARRLRSDPRENPERGLADRQLVELGVDAAELVDPALVAGLDLDLAHRQRRVHRLDRAEAAAPRLGLAQEVEVDLDLEDVLHAADVGVAELLVGVEERAAALDARRRVDDLVAVDFAAAALDFVLRAQGKLGSAWPPARVSA